MKNKKEEVISLINNVQDILNSMSRIPNSTLKRLSRVSLRAKAINWRLLRDSLLPNILIRTHSTLFMSMGLQVVVRVI